jgi:hypothetical protein
VGDTGSLSAAPSTDSSRHVQVIDASRFRRRSV